MPHKTLRCKLGIAVVLAVLACLDAWAQAEVLTLPLDARPAWLREEGIVMAGSWEPLPFRVRRDGGDGYTPTDEQRAAYAREHSPEMIDRLKALGVNFVMIHCYKGGGLEAEKESMQDAVHFAQLCHEAGLHVGVYTYSGAFIWELFFKEMPQAKDWVLLDKDGQPVTYGKATYRYYWNRNHPDAQAFYRGLVTFAIQDIKADLIHLDNYTHGPGLDACSQARFREYLRASFSPEALAAFGVNDVSAIAPPLQGAADAFLRRAWLDFQAQSLADSYADMTRHARSLRPDILMECNPGGPGESIGTRLDHGRILTGGEAFWDEGQASGYREGKLHTRVRTYKIARLLNNMAFAYSTTPVELAEAMAFNLDCLGCVWWFEYAKDIRRPGTADALMPDIERMIRFFHARRALLRDATVVADVAVLRSFPSQVFGGAQCANATAHVEQTLIENPSAFQIIYDEQLKELARWRVLVLAGCMALSDAQIAEIEQFAKNGGVVCALGPVATHDEWMRPRTAGAFASLPAERIVRFAEDGDILAAIRLACPTPSLALSAPPGVCCELTQQPGRRLVHLVNYSADSAARQIEVRVALPPGAAARSVTLAGPELDADSGGIAFREENGIVVFTVPEVKVYIIAIVEYGKPA